MPTPFKENIVTFLYLSTSSTKILRGRIKVCSIILQTYKKLERERNICFILTVLIVCRLKWSVGFANKEIYLLINFKNICCLRNRTILYMNDIFKLYCMGWRWGSEEDVLMVDQVIIYKSLVLIMIILLLPAI